MRLVRQAIKRAAALLPYRITLLIRKSVNTFRPTAVLLAKVQRLPDPARAEAMLWSDEKHHKAAYYSKLDAGSGLLADYITSTAAKSESVLDICCNQGRILLELRRRGFAELHGFDIMGPAIEILKSDPDYSPMHVHVEHCMAQDYFKDKENDAFDWAIAYSATIEIIHPDFDIFSELGRTVRKGMVLVLNEDGHRYPRFYRLLHRMNGFDIVATQKVTDDMVLIHSVKRST